MGGFADDEREWLEADGLGGFASGTVSGVRTRRYHGLLLTATTPPTGRMMLLSGFDAWVDAAAGRTALSSQRYAGDRGADRAGDDANDRGEERGASRGGHDAGDNGRGVIHPDGASRIESFSHDPWPTWTFRLDNGVRIQQEVLVPHGRAAVIVIWRLASAPMRALGGGLRLVVRPFLSGRDYHATHHENASLRADARQADDVVVWTPYDGVPPIVSRTNGRYEHQPDWYRQFLYTAERDRGLDAVEDLWTPGWLLWDLTAADAVWYVQAQARHAPREPRLEPAAADVTRIVSALRDEERARREALFATGEAVTSSRAASPPGRMSPPAGAGASSGAAIARLYRAADAYLVRRGTGRTIVAGYPWFTDWGRDTFIALRGLCLTTGRLDDARDILLEWAGSVSEGMLPNRFLDRSAAAAGGDADADAPEYHAVDASLWFIVAVQALCDLCDLVDAGRAAHAAVLSADARAAMLDAVQQILDGYARGTRYGIRMDADGLLACGVPGMQLTWMDARVGDRVVTPRIGKPVEVQALWLNALRVGAVHDPRWAPLSAQAHASFEQRFWNPHASCLYDVVDVDHEPGKLDPSFRPNQIFAIGGLPQPVLDEARARMVVDAVERRLLTPLGLRSLAPGEPWYVPHYGGGPAQRDAAYHQGAVWPWLMGAFVDAWLRVHGRSDAAIEEARRRFLAPLLAHLEDAGLGHVSEIADPEPPFTPAGCPFQAWSLGELLRICEALGVSSSAALEAARTAAP